MRLSAIDNGVHRYLQIWLRWIVNRPWPCLLLYLVLTALAGYVASSRLGVNADTSALLDQQLPFLQAEREISARFPVFNDTVLLVLTGSNARALRTQTQTLHAHLQQQTDLFTDVVWPAGDDWFQRKALLYQNPAALQQLADQLSTAQPMLAMLQQQTNALSLFELMLLAQQNSQRSAHADAMSAMLSAVSTALQAIAAGHADGTVHWHNLLAANIDQNEQQTQQQRELIVLQPILDTSRMLSATEPLQYLQQLRDDLGLAADPEHAADAVSMQITGKVALKHEELLSSMRGAASAGLLALVMVAGLLWLALRSAWMLVAALLTLLSGFIITAAFAALAVGDINLITIAFVVLYIGLGINYSIHFILRYQEQLAAGTAPASRSSAIVNAGVLLLAALALSAITTMTGFFAFIPTSYQGVAELGLIAGVSIPITLLTHYTLLPALLRLLPQPTARRLRPVQRGAWLDLPLQYRPALLWGVAIMALVAALLAPQIRFDSDPLNLRQQDAESVRAMRTLLADGRGDFRALMTTAANAGNARELAAHLRQLDTVDRVLSADSLVPADQDDKLWQLDDLRFLLGTDILQHDWQLQPVAAQDLFTSMQNLQAQLQQQQSQPELAQALSAVLALRASNNPADSKLATEINQRLLAELPPLLQQLQRMLAVREPITVEDLPQRLRTQWIAADGSWLLRIYPAADANDLARLHGFVADVRKLTSNVAGAAIKQIESGRAISQSFYQALFTALVVISLLLLILLRSVAMTLRILLPLLLGGALTMAAMVLLDVPLNYANIIALPLLLGVAVDNGIHLVWRHQLGALPQGNVLRTATARAIVFAGLTSAVSFGNLGFSSHAGSASMGILLGAGLLIMMLCTLLILPALLPSDQIADNSQLT